MWCFVRLRGRQRTARADLAVKMKGKESNNECVGAKKERGVVPSQTRNRSSIEQEKVEKRGVDCRPEGGSEEDSWVERGLQYHEASRFYTTRVTSNSTTETNRNASLPELRWTMLRHGPLYFPVVSTYCSSREHSARA